MSRPVQKLELTCPECETPIDARRQREVALLVDMFGIVEEARLCACGQYVWVERDGRRELVDPMIDPPLGEA